MKRRYAAIVLGLTLTFTSASFAYAAADTAAETADSTAEKAEEAAQEKVYGEVTETGDDSITVNTGTLKEEAKPAEGEKAASETENAEAEAADTETAETDTTEAETADTESTEAEAADPAEAADTEKPEEILSMLDLTGESQTIKVTEETTYEKQIVPEKPAEAEKAAEMEAADPAEAEAADPAEAEAADAAEAEAVEGAEAEKIQAEVPEMETESIALADIQVGDIVKITFDQDGNAATVVVLESKADAPDKEEKSQETEAKDTASTETSDDSAQTAEEEK